MKTTRNLQYIMIYKLSLDPWKWYCLHFILLFRIACQIKRLVRI